MDQQFQNEITVLLEVKENTILKNTTQYNSEDIWKKRSFMKERLEMVLTAFIEE
jgi:hypothetical protein